MSDKVEIPIQRYEDLLHSEKVLDCLRATGVDNWEGYGDAISDLNNDDDETYEDIYGEKE